MAKDRYDDLYNVLKQAGVNDIGKDAAELRTWVNSDPSNVQKVYDILSKVGVKDIGKNADELAQWLNPATQQVQQPTQQQVQQPAVDVPDQSISSDTVPADSSAGNPQPQGWQPSVAQSMQFQAQFDQQNARLDAMMANSKQRMENMQKYFQGTKSEEVVDPSTGKRQTVYYTSDGRATTDPMEASRVNAYNNLTHEFEVTDEQGNLVGGKGAGKEAAQWRREQNADFYERQIRGRYQRGVQSAVEAAWAAADAKLGAAMEGHEAEYQGMAGHAMGPGDVAALGYRKAHQGMAASLTAHDMQTLADEAWASMSDEDRAAIVKEAQNMYWQLYPGASKEELASAAQSYAKGLVEQTVLDHAVKMNAPKNEVDYFLKKVMSMNSVQMLAEAAARSSAGTRGDMDARDMAMENYRKQGHTWLDIGGMVTGFVFDPLTLLAGGVGGAAGKGALMAGGRLLYGSARVGSRMLGSRLGGRLLAGSVGGAANFGTFEGVGEGLSQLRQGGWYNPDTGQIEGYNAGAMAGQLGHGMMMGGVTGIFGSYVGNAANRAVAGTASTLGKVGIRSAELGIGIVGEGAIFSTPEWIEGERDAMDVWNENWTMMAGFKSHHLLKSAPRTIRDLFAKKDAHGNNIRAGIETRLRGVMDGHSQLQLTADMRRELQEGGYGNLFSVEGMLEDAQPYAEDAQLAEAAIDKYRSGGLHGSNNKMLDFISDQRISEETRAMGYYLLTGRTLPMSTVIGCNVRTNADGTIVVESFGENGIITSHQHKNQRAANVERDKIMRQAELNSFVIGEQKLDQQAQELRIMDALHEVGSRHGVPGHLLMDLLTKGDGELTPVEKEWREEVREELAKAGDKGGSTELKATIGEKHGVDVDKALSKEMDRRTANEQAALDEYAQSLYPKRSDVDVVVGDPDDPSPDYQRGKAASDQERSDIYLENMFYPTEESADAWQGVSDALTEKAQYWAAQRRQAYQNSAHTDGSLRPAVIRGADGAEHEVFIVDGKAEMTDEGDIIDTDWSDETIVIYDQNTGERRMIPATDIVRLGEPMGLDRALQEVGGQALEHYYELVDRASGKLDINEGDQVTAPNGEAGTVTAHDREQGQVAVTFADGNTIIYADKELQDVADQIRINDFNQRRPDLQRRAQRDAERAESEADLLENREAEPTPAAEPGEQPADEQTNQPAPTDTAEPAERRGEPTVDDYKPQDRFTIRLDDGTEVEVEVLDAGDGEVQVMATDGTTRIKGSKVSTRFTVDELNRMRTDLSHDTEAPAELPEPSPTDIVPDINDEGKPATPTAQPPVADNTQAQPPAGKPKTALEQMPRDKRGNVIYEGAEPATAWDALVEESEGDESIAADVAKSEVERYEAEIKKAEKIKVEGSTPTEKIASAKAKKAAIDQLTAKRDHWQKMLDTPAQRKAAEDKARRDAEAEQRRIAQEQARAKAEAEAKAKAEREEQERIEREAINGVPEWTQDTPGDSRKRGYRRVAGQKVDRQAPVADAPVGSYTTVSFGKDQQVAGIYQLVDAAAMQPSHLDGQRNPLHFLDEAQPKERTDAASRISAKDMAANMRPNEITEGATAYVGAPVTNARSEVIQGNNRAEALRLMWESNPDTAKAYKQWLVENAAKFGLDPKAIEAMERPVLVRRVDVDDAKAIELGQYVAQDTESGGVERIKPRNAAQKMGAKMKDFAEILMRSSDEELSFAQLVDQNGEKVLEWMSRGGYITDTQYQSAHDSKGNVTAEAKNDLMQVLYQHIFQGGSTKLAEQFDKLPSKAQKAILATMYRDFDSPKAQRMIDHVQQSIMAFAEVLAGHPGFANAKTGKDALAAIEEWKRQYALDDSTGESYLPSGEYSNFALTLAALYKGHTQKMLQQTFKELFDLIQGTKADTLFEEADKEPRTLAEAAKDVMNRFYNIKLNDDGRNGNGPVGSADEPGNGGRPGSPADNPRRGSPAPGAEPAKPAAGDDGPAPGGGQESLEKQRDNWKKKVLGLSMRLSSGDAVSARKMLDNYRKDMSRIGDIDDLREAYTDIMEAYASEKDADRAQALCQLGRVVNDEMNRRQPDDMTYEQMEADFMEGFPDYKPIGEVSKPAQEVKPAEKPDKPNKPAQDRDKRINRLLNEIKGLERELEVVSERANKQTQKNYIPDPNNTTDYVAKEKEIVGEINKIKDELKSLGYETEAKPLDMNGDIFGLDNPPAEKKPAKPAEPKPYKAGDRVVLKDGRELTIRLVVKKGGQEGPNGEFGAPSVERYVAIDGNRDVEFTPDEIAGLANDGKPGGKPQGLGETGKAGGRFGNSYDEILEDHEKQGYSYMLGNVGDMTTEQLGESTAKYKRKIASFDKKIERGERPNLDNQERFYAWAKRKGMVRAMEEELAKRASEMKPQDGRQQRFDETYKKVDAASLTQAVSEATAATAKDGEPREVKLSDHEVSDDYKAGDVVELKSGGRFRIENVREDGASTWYQGRYINHPKHGNDQGTLYGADIKGKSEKPKKKYKGVLDEDQDAFGSALDEFRKALRNPHMGFAFEALPAAGKMGFYLMKSGARKIKEWCQSFLDIWKEEGFEDEFGDIRPWLGVIYEHTRLTDDVRGADWKDALSSKVEVAQIDFEHFGEDVPATPFDKADTVVKNAEKQQEADEAAHRKALLDKHGQTYYNNMSKRLKGSTDKSVRAEYNATKADLAENERHLLDLTDAEREKHEWTLLKQRAEIQAELRAIEEEMERRGLIGAEAEAMTESERIGQAVKEAAEPIDAKEAAETAGDSRQWVERINAENSLVGDLMEEITKRSFGFGEPLTMRAVEQMAKKLPALADVGKTDLQELAELAVVNLVRTEARSAIGKGSAKEREAFDRVVAIYNAQPSLNARDSERYEKQQYSTPTPFGYVMGQFLQAGRKVKSMLEPSAGNGALTTTFDKGIVIANDIDERRLVNLRSQGFACVLEQNGLLPFRLGHKVDAVATNPPFGTVEQRVYDGIFKISGLEHQMAINALDEMADDGRAAIVIGGNSEYRENGALNMKDMGFFSYLYSHYNVADVINLDGAMYGRNGTKYPVRMILIDGRKTGEFVRAYPPVKSKARAEQVKTFDELYNRIQDDIHDLQSRVESESADSGTEADGGRSAQGSATTDNPGNGIVGKPIKGGRGRGAASQPAGLFAGMESLLDGDESATDKPVGGLDNGDRGTSVGDGSAPQREAGTDRNGANQPAGTTAGHGAIGRGLAVSQSQPGEKSPDTEGKPKEGTGGKTAGHVSVNPSQQQRKEGEKPVVKLTDEKVAYPHRSQSGVVGSVVPAQQATVLAESLERIGDVDQFLVDELGYANKDELFSHLSAEQIDSVALALKQMGEGNAFIIGDMTGVGKGRQAAALVRYAVKQGKKPIFFTAKPDLFSDIYRDLSDIGNSELRPFIFASNSKGNMTDAQGNVVYKVPSAKEYERVMNHILRDGTLPEEYDYAVCTYSQIQNGLVDYEAKGGTIREKEKSYKGKIPATDFPGQERRRAIEQLVKDNYMILDESHNVSGNSGQGGFMQMLIQREGGANIRGITFLSATFAKRSDNMPLYAMRTAMAESGVKPDEMIKAIAMGGVPLQEIMSKQLVQSGQMIRRERSFEGVAIDWLPISEEADAKQRAAFNEVASIFSAIRDFQEKHIKPLVEAMSAELAEQGGQSDIQRGTEAMGVRNTPFASKMYNLVNQLLFSLKAEAIADRAIENLKKGLKPVISFVNTMEGLVKELPQDVPMDEMPNLGASLRKAIDGVMRYQKTDADGNTTYGVFSTALMGKEGQQAYQDIVDSIDRLSADLPLSPMDAIRMRIEEAGYKVEEIAGRENIITKDENGRFVAVHRGKPDTKGAARRFNAGETDVLMINKSGSTGISLHASNKFADQRQRAMIFAQFQMDINDEVQMRGRIDRTGQVVRGKYEYIMSTIPSEQRLQMMFKAKLKSLDANTTSSQKSKFNEMEVVDYLNKYGDEVVWQYMLEHPELEELLGDPLKMFATKEEREAAENAMNARNEEGAEKKTLKTGCAAKISRHLAFLPVEEQDRVFADITEAYRVKMDLLNEAGENDLEITTMPLRAKTLGRKIWSKGTDPGSGNAFADNTYVEQCEVDVLRKPMKHREVAAMTAKLAGGLPYDQWREKAISDIEAHYGKKIADARAKLQAEGDARERKAYDKAVETLKKNNGKIMDPSKRLSDAQIAEQARVLADEEREKQQSKMEAQVGAIESRKESIIFQLGQLQAGTMMAIPTDLSSESVEGFSMIPALGSFVGFKFSKDFSPSSSTAIFATLDGRRKLEIPLSKTETLSAIRRCNSLNHYAVSEFRDRHRGESQEKAWDSEIPTQNRKKAYIITGNILKAIIDMQKGGQKGKLVSYSTAEGDVRQGLLMPDKFNPSQLTSTVPISSQQSAIESGETVVSGDKAVEVARARERWNNHYTVKVPKSKAAGGQYFLDKELLRLVHGGNFTTQGGKMAATVWPENLAKVLRRLDKLGVTVQAKAQLRDDKDEDDGKRYRFEGERGRGNWPRAQESLREALSMLGGKSLDEAAKDTDLMRRLKAETGWEIGADGKLRFEVGETVQQLREDRLKKDFWGNGWHCRLEDIYPDEDLYQSYPELRRVKVKISPKKAKGGNYAHGSRTITINDKMPGGTLRDDAIKTLVHEVQHAIQHIEGFALGGNKKSGFQAAKQRMIDEAQAELDWWQNFLERDRRWLADVNAHPKATAEQKARAEAWVTDDEAEVKRCQSEVAWRKSLDFEDTLDWRHVSRRGYRSLAGEVEARNVAERLGLSDEQRASLALDTEDIPRDEQLLRFGKDESFLQRMLKRFLDRQADQQELYRVLGRDPKMIAAETQPHQFDVMQDPEWSHVKDQELIDKLEAGPKRTLYAAMVMEKGPNGETYLYPPMSSMEKGADGRKQMRQPSVLGRWEESEERPDKIKNYKTDKAGREVGSFPLLKNNGTAIDAAYNPYFHQSDWALNDQFSSAWNRPDIVVVEVEIPESELAGEYRAKYAKDATGKADWKDGGLTRSIGGRNVYLSRWRKPVRVLTDAEAAQMIAPRLRENGVAVPYNVVTPGLREALAKEGVGIAAPERGNAGDASRAEWQKYNEQAKRRTATEIGDRLGAKVRIVTDVSELTHKNAKTQEKMRGSMGWYDTKTDEVVIVMPNNPDAAEVARTALHEIVTHRGLRKMMGENFDTFLENVYRNVNKEIRSEITELARKKYRWNIAEATEEWMADLTSGIDFERAEQQPWFKQVWRTIRDCFMQMLAKAGIKLSRPLGEADIKYMLWRSYQLQKSHGPLAEAENIAKQQELGVGQFRYRQHSTDGNPRTAPDPSAARDEYERRVREPNKARTVKATDNWAWRMKKNYADSMAALKAFQEAVTHETGNTVDGYEDAYKAENAMASSNKAQAEAYERDYWNPMVRAISALTGNGSTYHDVIEYAIAKHGIERNKVLARRDAEQQATADLRDDFRKANAQMADAIKQQDQDLIDDAQLLLDQLQDKWDQLADAYEAENRERDYSGLTELTGMDDVADAEAEAGAIADAFELKHGKGLIGDFWDRVNAATQRQLDIAYNAGLMDRAAYERTSSMFQYYVPLRGWNENVAEDEYNYYGNGRATAGRPQLLKRANGRTSVAEDPFAYIGHMGNSTINQANRNIMKRHFLNFVLNNPTALATVKEQWYVKNALGQWEANDPVIPPLATGDQIAAIVEQHDADMRALEQQGLATQKRTGIRLGLRASQEQVDEHKVSVKVGAREYTIYINGNPAAAQAVNGATNPDVHMGRIESILSKWKGRFSQLLTSKNAAFVAANLAMDTGQSIVYTAIREDAAYNKQAVKNAAKVFGTAAVPRLLAKWKSGKLDDNVEMERYFKEYLENGGETGFTQLLTVDDFKRNIGRFLKDANAAGIGRAARLPKHAWRGLWDGIEFMNRCAEDTNRFICYMTSRQQGRDIRRSIWDAKEITVNFSKKGAGGMWARQMNFAYVFFNAAIQAMRGFGNVVGHNPRKASAWMGALGASGVLVPMLNAALIATSKAVLGWDDDEDWYGNLPSWQRRNNLCLYIPGTKGKFLTIPLAHELRPWYGMGESAWSALAGKQEPVSAATEAVMGFNSMLPIDYTGNGGNLAVNLTPTLGQPPMQVAVNKDFFGKPIYKRSDYLEGDPEYTKAYRGANTMLVGWSEFVNSLGREDTETQGPVDEALGAANNPDVLEHILTSYFGGPAKLLNQTAKTISMAWDADARQTRNVPIVSRFLADGSEERTAGAAVTRRYWDYIKGEYSKMEHDHRWHESRDDDARLDAIEASEAWARYERCKPIKQEIDACRKELKETTDPELRREIEAEIYGLMKELLAEAEK